MSYQKLAAFLRLTVLGFYIFFLCLPGLVSAGETPLFLYRGLRPASLGNAYEAIANDLSAIHYNPAGLTQINKFSFQLLPIRGAITQDIFDQALSMENFLDDVVSPLTNSANPLFDPTVALARSKLVEEVGNLSSKHLGVNIDFLGFGLSVPMVDKQMALGLSLYFQTLTEFRLAKKGVPWPDPILQMLDDEIIYRSVGQGALATSLAYRVDLNQPFLKSIHFGTTARLIGRGEFSDVDDPFTISDLLNPKQFTEEYFDLGPNQSVADFIQENIDRKFGYSIDFGTIVIPFDGLNLGVVGRNLVGGIGGEETFPPNVAISMAVRPLNLLKKTNTLLDMTLAATYDDPNGDDALGGYALDQLSDNLHLGAEVRLLPDQFIEAGLRVGNNQGFLTMGGDLRLLKFIHLEIARYSNLQSDWWIGAASLDF